MSLDVKRLAGIGVALWFLGVLIGVGIALLVGAVTQEHKNQQFTYAINRGACAAYSLVDPTIKANNTLVIALNRAIDDPKTSAAMLKIDRERLKTVNQQRTAFQSFRSIYGTIPLDYDCTRLPKQPPS